MESKLILLILGSSNLYISLQMKLPIRKFSIKNIVPMLHKPHAGAYARGEGVGAKKNPWD